MPGLSQLKQFNKDLLSLGDEITIRASRGEKPVEIIIPKDVEDKNDSEDFVLGMPEIEAEIDNSPVEEDLSDLAGLTNPSSSEKSTDASPSFEAPDLSSLLNPIAAPDLGDSSDMMPDLSMFEDTPQEEVVEEVEEEPEEISVADMGLDALLSGAGFDSSEDSSPEPEPESEPLLEKDFEEISDLDSLEAAESEDLGEEVTDDFSGADNVASENANASPVDDGLSEIERDLLASMGGDFGSSSDSGNLSSSKNDAGERAGSSVGGASATEPGISSGGSGEPSLDELLGNLDFDNPSDDFSGDADAGSSDSADSSSGDFTSTDFGFESPDGGLKEAGSGYLDDAGVVEDLGELDDLGDLGGVEDLADAGSSGNAGDLGDIGDLGEVEDLGDFEAPEAPADFDFSDSSDSGDNGDNGGDLGDFALPGDDFATGAESTTDNGDFSTSASGDFNLDDLELPDDFGSAGASGGKESGDNGDALGDFALPGDENADGGESANAGDAVGDLGDFSSFGDETAPGDASDALGGLAGLGDLDSLGGETSTGDEIPGDENTTTSPLDGLDSLDDFASTASENPDLSDESSNPPDGLFNMDDMDFGSAQTAPVDFNADDEIPDYDDTSSDSATSDDNQNDFGGDFNSDFGDNAGENSDDEIEDAQEFDENQPIETFDTSEMDDMDFGIQDTDSQLNGGGGDFELGNGDDFAMEGEFEIPGFSDVTNAKEEKKSKPALPKNNAKDKEKKDKGKKNKPEPELDQPDFSQAEESEDLPPNTLSDSQYKKFLKNLGEYPLNVRLAFEDLIVQDEFTDDAEFEVIEKILNKAPARQVASMLEKMLDTSIPVPRDFEHRTAEEYEAYKKSLSYQLKNKIIPGLMVGVVALLLLFGIFNFSKNCIYKPLKANSLYKQGYALLQEDEYPQSEMKFEEAVKYRINKKWFFNYARGYREHKQYQRSAAMYQKILNYFRHDKEAGLEYADMELEDLANYEKAEEIVRRQVLDYHINDADGILKLGDIFLEWGTEKDPAKLENAREQYATLLQLYGPSDLYMSRMMRYFIRTDNLRNVIQLQKTFEPREKSLVAEDWAELSGYLLEKYYGPLAPSEEYLRYEIEGLRGLLVRAVKTGPENPVAYYNLAKYFIKSGETGLVESSLQHAIECFNMVPSMKKRDIYKYIDSYRLLGEYYTDTEDYLQAQEQFAEGISLYTTERDNAGFQGSPDIGKLYEDMANIKYFISGDYAEALQNYKYSVELENDTPSIRYKIGYIQYKNKNYTEALGSFMKAGDGNVKERNLLLSMANTLSLRGDDYAAQGYYNQLIDSLDDEIAKRGLVLPQANVKDYDLVNTYLSAANNYGVTLYRLAKKTGNSGLNAQAIVQFQQSLRAWDALTRNQETLVRLSGSNLAEQNIQYITHPVPEFEPAIYTDISKTLVDNERF